MRIKGLDFLRGVAILLVLFRHSDLKRNLLQHFGWLGVDLFFVLSGFLVSGLLFREYKKRGKVNLKRFLSRRGFKIYPPFYLFMGATLAFDYWHNQTVQPYKKVLSEVFYMQSYFPRIWLHTWSLAVEEHFYLVLALFVFIAVKTKLLPFKKSLLAFFGTLIVTSFLLRLQISYPERNSEFFAFIDTHLRSDGILIGVLIAYLYHFTRFIFFFHRWRKVFFILALLLIAPGFYFHGGRFFMNTFGLSLVNLGFGIFVLFALDFHVFSKRPWASWIRIPTKVCVFIGIHSYSIYLWHLNAKRIVNNFEGLSVEISTAVYLLLALIIGIGFSYLIEKPTLKLREMLVK